MAKAEADMELLEPEITLKTARSDDAGAKNKTVTAKEDDLESAEVLRESPVQWPERLPGMDEFLLRSEIPVHIPNINAAQILSNSNMADINQFARMSPDKLMEKIKSMRDEINKLSVRETEEMARAKLLGIFDHDRLTKKKTSKR